MDKLFSESFCFQQQKMHGQGLTVSPIDFSGGCNCHGPFLNEFMVHGKHAEFKVFPVLIHKTIFQENPTFLIGPSRVLHFKKTLYGCGSIPPIPNEPQENITAAQQPDANQALQALQVPSSQAHPTLPCVATERFIELD